MSFTSIETAHRMAAVEKKRKEGGDVMGTLTLRDYFAAKAMPVAWGMYEELYDCSPEELIPFVADYAYDLADAMLKRRES